MLDEESGASPEGLGPIREFLSAKEEADLLRELERLQFTPATSSAL